MRFHRHVYELAIELGPDPNPAELPRVATAEQLASVHRRYWGLITAKAIRRDWLLDWHMVRGREVTEVTPFLTEAQRRFEAQPQPPLLAFPHAAGANDVESL